MTTHKMTEAQVEWANGYKRLREKITGTSCEVVDYKPDNCGMGVFFVAIKRRNGKGNCIGEKEPVYIEEYRPYPLALIDGLTENERRNTRRRRKGRSERKAS